MNELKIRLSALVCVIFICILMSLYSLFEQKLFLAMISFSFLFILGKHMQRTMKEMQILRKGEEVFFEIVDNEKTLGPRGLLNYYPVLKELGSNNIITYKKKRSLYKLLIGGKVKGFKYQNEYYVLFQ